MKKIFLAFFFATSILCAKADFSEMSTEELIALIGYVDQTKEERFYQELDKRVEGMNEEQKALYEDDKKRRDVAKN